jgi:hypothetical protein
MRGGVGRPGRALQRTTGADLEFFSQGDFQCQTYATCRDLQSRHISRRCGLDGRRALLIAALHFGEVGR